MLFKFSSGIFIPPDFSEMLFSYILQLHFTTSEL